MVSSHRSEARYRGHVDDVALGVEQVREGELHEVKHRTGVDVHLSVELLQRDALYAASCQYSCTVMASQLILDSELQICYEESLLSDISNRMTHLKDFH